MRRIGVLASALLILVLGGAIPGIAESGDITLASTSDAGVKGNSYSSSASLSADGTTVAFHSSATNLDPADVDDFSDIYVKDLLTADITLASTSDAGVKGNSTSGSPSLTADGTAMAFSSYATNLDPGDTDSTSDIFVKDLLTGDITLASMSDAGVKGNSQSSAPVLSREGQEWPSGPPPRTWTRQTTTPSWTST